MNQFAGKLELEAGITVLQNECERIFSSVPIHFGKGVSLTPVSYTHLTLPTTSRV